MELSGGGRVDARHFYAVDNYVIGKYDKKTGKLVKKWPPSAAALSSAGIPDTHFTEPQPWIA